MLTIIFHSLDSSCTGEEATTPDNIVNKALLPSEGTELFTYACNSYVCNYFNLVPSQPKIIQLNYKLQSGILKKQS